MHMSRLQWMVSICMALTLGLLAACALPTSSPSQTPSSSSPSSLGPTPPITKRVLVPTPTAAAEDGSLQSTVSADTSVHDDTQLIAQQAEELASPLRAEQAALLAKLPSRGPAPELTNTTWFNSEPLQLADLRGNVVIVEFWTYG